MKTKKYFQMKTLKVIFGTTSFIAAQKATKEKYKHPYFWGAFVMTGE